MNRQGDIESEKEWRRHQSNQETGFTASSMLKPFVHLIRFPEAINVCMTGKEKVKPISLCLPGGTLKSSLSSETNFPSSAAI